MNEYFSKLNEVVLDYINYSELYDFGEFSAIDSFTNIILSSRIPSFRDKIKNRFGLSKSMSLSLEFFDFIGDNYVKQFFDVVNNDRIIYVYDPKGLDNATSFHQDGVKKIYFPYSKKICDVFALTHEILHDMNLDVNNINEMRNLYTEYISIFGEMLLSDYISSNYDIKCSVNNRYTFDSCFLKAIKVNFYLELLRCFMENGEINKYNLDKIILRYNPYYHGYLFKMVDNIVDNEEIPIIYEYRYVIGILLSCYSKDLFNNGKFSIDMFKYVNENINDMIDEDLYDLLSLDVADDFTLALTNDSYEKLSKSYVKIMGKA